MNFSKRIVLFAICFMFCVSTTMIPVSAEGGYCDTYGHDYRITSHGSFGDPYGMDNTNCYYQQHWQCIFTCYYCGNTIMMNHIYAERHAWANKWNEDGGGWDYYCAKCQTWRSWLD